MPPSSVGGEGGVDPPREGERSGHQPIGCGFPVRSGKVVTADEAGTSRSRGTRGERSANDISSSDSE